MTVPVDTYPAVRAAVVALDSFGALDRPTAASLLAMWARRFQLSSAEVRQVLDHYPAEAKVRTAGTDFGTGFDFSREPDDVSGAAVPPYVGGGPLGRRDR